MSEKKLTVDNTVELLKGLEVMSRFAGEVAKDGKVQADDLIHLIDVAKSFDKLKAAVENVDQVGDELKDLDQAEILEIISAAQGVYKAFKEAKS